jgi:hypothetical protein
LNLADIPDPFPLRAIPVPLEVSEVAGCDCGGAEWHRSGSLSGPECSIWSLPEAERLAAITAAQGRLSAYTAALNARLHEQLGTLP